MKTLLIRLNHTGFPIPPPDMPLGVLYVAAALEQAGHTVIVRDLCRQLIEPDVWDQIRTGEIGLVGISFLSFVRSEGYRLAREIKTVNPGACLVAGGIFPASMPEDICTRYPFDAIVAGEGETAMVEIARRLDAGESIGGVPGVYHRRHGWGAPAELIADIDTIPFPARHHSNYDWFKMTCATLMPDRVVNGVRLGDARWAPIIASRGCVGRCVFCNAFSHWGNRVRFRSADNILDEIEAMYENDGVRLLAFNDDAFPLRRGQCEEFCTGLIERGLKIAWQTTTRGDTLDRELCRLMAAAGCFMVAVGVESGSETVHATMKKHLDLNKAARALAHVRDAGMTAYALLMIGNPGESDQTIAETSAWLMAARPNWYSFVRGVMVVPGTELFGMAEQAGKITRDTFLDASADGLPLYEVEHSIDDLNRWADQIESTVPRCLQ